MDRNSLMHHGVKGMHWGIRRYQNEDGSLTALGREHYGIKSLSIVNRDVHSDDANRLAVEERKKMYKRINRVKEQDYREIRRIANELYGKGKSPEKEKYLTENFMAAAEMALAAEILVDNSLNVKYSNLALSSIKDDDIERGIKAVKKSERQTNWIIAGIGGAMAIGGIAKVIASRKKSGG